MNYSRIPPPLPPCRRRKHIVKYAAPAPPRDPARGGKMDYFNEIAAKTRTNTTIDARDGNIMLSTPPRRGRRRRASIWGAFPGRKGRRGHGRAGEGEKGRKTAPKTNFSDTAPPGGGAGGGVRARARVYVCARRGAGAARRGGRRGCRAYLT